MPRSSQPRPRSAVASDGALEGLDALAARADGLAAAWAARARATTTVGQERAVLRLFGVHGLDAAGRPLASGVADRWRAGDAGAAFGGIALPFAMALLEYDVAPQQLALDVASGAIDLALEAELLRQPDRRAVAAAEVERLVDAAADRIDANRIARRELVSLLGDPPAPWQGIALAESGVDAALGEAAALVGAGADLLEIGIPVGRELADRMHDAGFEVVEWQAGSGRGAPPQPAEPAPTGSQRGLAALRERLDEIAAERGAYGRLATVPPALGAPEAAVVAAFERIDVVAGSPFEEIVTHGVDPDRALSDHAFANRLHARAGSLVSIDAGPLVVAPDLAAGVPSDAATRSGRALALQALGAAFARHTGLPTSAVVLGAMPGWVSGEAAPASRAFAEVAIRRALFPDHRLAFAEAEGPIDAAAAWSSVVMVALAFAGPTAFIVHRAGRSASDVLRRSRAAARIAGELVAATGTLTLRDAALEHARATVAAATATLDLLANRGWHAVTGTAPVTDHPVDLGRGTVIERGDPFDALAPLGQPPAFKG